MSNIRGEVQNKRLSEEQIAARGFSVLETVANCVPKRCPIAGICRHTKNGICEFEAEYIKSRVDGLMALVEHDARERGGDGETLEIDPYLMDYVGYRLMPLFGQMAQLEKLRMSLSSAGCVRKDTGIVAVHDVFREIRMAHRDIECALKESGLKDMIVRNGFLGGGNFGMAKTVTGDGDPGYYDRMIAGNG